MQILCFLAAFASIASIANATCPIKEKCPYAKYTPSTHGSSDGCPLKTAGCPYYETHAKDKTLADFVTEADGKCPLSEKCPLYKDVKEGKKIDLSGDACPLKDKCPYYKTIKSHGDSLDCPLEKSCPHFKKDFKSGKHPLHGSGKDSHNPKDCPYLKSHKTRPDQESSESDKPSCPMKGSSCPYASKNAAAAAGSNGEGGCPLQKAGCPYYENHGKDVDTADLLKHAGGCPHSKKFVKDGVAADAGAAGGCPLAKAKCPHFNKDLDASEGSADECPYLKKKNASDGNAEGTTESAPKECPLKGKCPYVSDHHVEHTGEGCPLKKGACPYYNEHAKDKDIADLLQHEGGCPLKTKCPYYKALKNGEKVDLSGTKCPLAEKCPYYKEVKDHGAADCPLEKSCPHFKKDFEKGGHAHHGGKHDSHQAKDCPYIKNHKTKGETHDEL